MNIPVDTILALVYFYLPIIFSLIALYYAFYFLKTARALENTPPSKIRSAAQGYVELLGRSAALPERPVEGLLTQKPCAWYGYTIEQFTRPQYTDENAEASWNIVEQGASFNPFLLIDETGKCVVLPEKAQIIPNAITTWRGYSPTPSLPPNSFWTSLFGGMWGNFRYTERRLELDSTLYMTGQFYTWQADSSELNRYPLLTQHAKNNGLNALNVIVQTTPEVNEPYIISTLSEKLLVRRFRRKAVLYFVGFLFFVALTTHSKLPFIKERLDNWAFKMKSFHPSSTWFVK